MEFHPINQVNKLHDAFDLMNLILIEDDDTVDCWNTWLFNEGDMILIGVSLIVLLHFY